METSTFMETNGMAKLPRKVNKSQKDMSVFNKGWCLHVGTMVTKVA